MRRIAFTALAFATCSCFAADRKDTNIFPALGITAERKVEVAWNRFYDHAGLTAIQKKLHEAFPQLTKLYSIGQSIEGRDLWCLEVTAKDTGDPNRKPGMWI